MISIIGAGSWGTALAQAAAQTGKKIHLWDRNSSRLKEIEATRMNASFHPNILLSPGIVPEHNLEFVLSKSSLLVFAIPSYTIPDFIKEFQSFISMDTTIISAAKGIHSETLFTVSEMFQETFGKDWTDKHYVALSGPSFAHDVVRGKFTAVTLASHNAVAVSTIQKLFHSPLFHFYSSADVIGVEISGALKNVVAVATGAMDGFGFGLNARAALMTRALTEIRKIGVAKGADPLTFAGLSGLGDLILTCTGQYSRNRTVGLKLAQGMHLKEVIREVGQVAEGIRTAKSAHLLAQKLGVDVPIIDTVYRVLYEGIDPQKAMEHLFQLSPSSDI